MHVKSRSQCAITNGKTIMTSTLPPPDYTSVNLCLKKKMVFVQQSWTNNFSYNKCDSPIGYVVLFILDILSFIDVHLLNCESPNSWTTHDIFFPLQYNKWYFKNQNFGPQSPFCGLKIKKTNKTDIEIKFDGLNLIFDDKYFTH